MNKLPNYFWIKFPIASLNDPIFMQLSDASVGIYLKIYLLAGHSDAGGLLCNDNKIYSLPDIAWLLRIDVNTLQQAIEELSVSGLVTIGERFSIVRFLEEQGSGDNMKREQWRERQQKHREKHSNNSAVTAQSPRSDAIDSDSESDSESEKEVEVEVEVESDIDIDKSRLSHGDNEVTTQSPLRGEKTTTTTSSSLSNETMKMLFHMLDKPTNNNDKSREDALLLSLRNKGIPANSKDEALKWAQDNGYR